MEDLGGARTHNTKSGNAHYMGTDEDDAIEYVKALLSFLPQNNLDEPVVDVRQVSADLDLDVSDLDRALDTLIPDSPTSPTTCTTRSPRSSTTRSSSRCMPLFAPNIVDRLRPGRGPLGRRRRQPADAVRRHPRHRRLREGRPVRAHLRRVQHPGADLRRRARLPARHRPGVERHHPPRRQADLRLRRGHRPAGHGHHPQGLRRRVRRDGLQAPRRRHQPRLADRPDRGHGRPGRGQHPLPQGAQARPTTRRRGARRAHRRSTRTRSPTPTSRPSAATSTP